MFSCNLEPLKIQKFSGPLAPTMVEPAGDTELSKSLHIFFANHFLILNWNPVSTLKKSGFDSAQGFPYESSPHIVYTILCVNSFLVFYYFSLL